MSVREPYTEQIFDPKKMSSLLLSSMLKKLNNSERELRTLTDNISDVLVRFDREGRIIYVNQRFQTLFEIGLSDVQGKTPTEIPNMPDSRLFEQVVLRVVRTEEKESFVHEIQEKNGDPLIGLVRISPEFDAEGKVQCVQLLVRDITEQKNYEKQLAAKELEFRSLAENIPDNIARWDTEGRYLYINPTHERLLGMTLSEAIGTFIPDAHTNVKAAIAQVAATGEKIKISQTATSEEGNVEYHEVTIVPERDGSGNIVSILGLGRDITEHNRVEEALRKALELNEEITNRKE